MKQSEADKQSESWDRESKTHTSILKYKARTCCSTHPFELADDFEVVEWLMFAGRTAVAVVCMMQRAAIFAETKDERTCAEVTLNSSDLFLCSTLDYELSNYVMFCHY